MRKSVKELDEYLKGRYICNESMGSHDMSTAIRDVLTDLIHLSDTVGIDLDTRLEDAREVYLEEIDIEDGPIPCDRLKNLLQMIHDNADHIVSTDEDGLTYRTVATCDASDIKAQAKEALKLVGEG